MIAYQTAAFAYQGVGQFAYQEGISVVPVVQEAPGDAGRKVLERQRCVLEIEGQTLVFENVLNLLDYLEARKEELEERAEQKAERAARRILKTGKAIKPQPLQIELSDILIVSEPRIREILLDIEQAYRDALQGVFAREAEEEDIAMISTLL